MSKFYGGERRLATSTKAIQSYAQARDLVGENRSNALPASTLSPAPGSALADASPNVLSGRDRGFYYDPPAEDDYAEGFRHKYGALQC